MNEELRCPSKIHALLVDEHTIEIKCDSRFCGAKPGVVVLHRWNTETGKFLKTLKYKDPNPVKERK